MKRLITASGNVVGQLFRVDAAAIRQDNLVLPREERRVQVDESRRKGLWRAVCPQGRRARWRR